MTIRTMGLILAVMSWVPFAAAVDNADQPSLDDLLDLRSPREGGPDQPGDQSSPNEPRLPDVELAPADAADAFRAAVGAMNQVAWRLGDQHDAGPSTQRMQKEILRKLDQVIATAKKSQSQSSSSGGGQQQQGGQQDSGTPQLAGQPKGGSQTQQSGGTQENTESFSPGGVGPLGPDGRPLAEHRAEWGNLPLRLREQLQEGYRERFSQIYRELTEAYYKRLAEQKQ